MDPPGTPGIPFDWLTFFIVGGLIFLGVVVCITLLELMERRARTAEVEARRAEAIRATEALRAEASRPPGRPPR